MSRVFCLLLKENPVSYAKWYEEYHEAYGIDPFTFEQWVKDEIVDAQLSTPKGTMRFLDVEEEFDPIGEAEVPASTPKKTRRSILDRVIDFFHRH